MNPTLLDQLQRHLNWRRIGNTTATINGRFNTMETILIVRDQQHIKSLLAEFDGQMIKGEPKIMKLTLKTIFDIPKLHGYNKPIIIDHFALSELITQHTAAIHKYYREKGEKSERI